MQQINSWQGKTRGAEDTVGYKDTNESPCLVYLKVLQYNIRHCANNYPAGSYLVLAAVVEVRRDIFFFNLLSLSEAPVIMRTIVC